ncbi:EXLDI protein [Nocardia terpenica]|uniref:EXLDI protein n=1 Tax=Nocardia terpenica TaxID=455432 RepID=A0A6G9YWN1_9NOCA|nr:EXLDI protein [Nocardia terpenica]QIS17735.1 EXLDI protein [Nocardia terpenica]
MTTDPQQSDVLDRVHGDEPEPVDGDLEQIVVKDGPGGARAKRFFGRFVAETRDYAKTGVTVIRVYRSRRGKFVVQHQSSDWSDFSSLANFPADLRAWRSMLGVGDPHWGDFEVDVVDSLDELRGVVPPKLYRRVVAAIEPPRLEDLDI